MVEGNTIVALKPLLGGTKICALAVGGAASAKAPVSNGPSQYLCRMVIKSLHGVTLTADRATDIPLRDRNINLEEVCPRLGCEKKIICQCVLSGLSKVATLNLCAATLYLSTC